jgi:hypothetical protein
VKRVYERNLALKKKKGIEYATLNEGIWKDMKRGLGRGKE